MHEVINHNDVFVSVHTEMRIRTHIYRYRSKHNILKGALYVYDYACKYTHTEKVAWREKERYMCASITRLKTSEINSTCSGHRERKEIQPNKLSLLNVHFNTKTVFFFIFTFLICRK